MRLAAHIDGRTPPPAEGQSATPAASAVLDVMVKDWNDDTLLSAKTSEALRAWLDMAVALVDEDNKKEEGRLDGLRARLGYPLRLAAARSAIGDRKPVFVLVSNYFRVRPVIHLAHLASRLKSVVLDDDQYDRGNSCLLNLLDFTARDLSDLGRAEELDAKDAAKLRAYRDQLGNCSYQLNAASIRLTQEIRRV